MKIYNTTTGQTVNLNYYDRRKDIHNQIDIAADITADDPAIVYNQDEDRHESSQDAIDYWQAWIRATELADDTERGVRQLLKEAGEDDIAERIREDVDQHYFEEES